jgi:hypothetical protein
LDGGGRLPVSDHREILPEVRGTADGGADSSARRRQRVIKAVDTASVSDNESTVSANARAAGDDRL